MSQGVLDISDDLVEIAFKEFNNTENGCMDSKCAMRKALEAYELEKLREQVVWCDPKASPQSTETVTKMMELSTGNNQE